MTLAAVNEEETPYEEALAVYAEMGYEWEPWKTTYVAVRDLAALGFEVSYESHPERISLTPAGQN